MTWEYAMIDLGTATARTSAESLLNAAGARGWELVQIVPPNRAFLKRAIAPPSKVQSKSLAKAKVD